MARSVSATVDRSVSGTSLRGRFAASCEPFLSGLVAMTFFARFYLPTEDTANGATLWIVAIWFVIGLFTLLLTWRGGGAARRFDQCDAAVLLLIGGQVASAVMIVATAGDKRAAVNIAWEWIGAGIVWFVLRSRVGGAAFRETFLRASVVTGCVLAGLGLWQHYVSQPALVREYGPLFDRLREATGGEAEVIQRQLAKSGVPTEGPALTLFEKRMRDSREPMGLFGLTNTFGGCLAVWLVLTLASFRRLGHVLRSRERLLRNGSTITSRTATPILPPLGGEGRGGGRIKGQATMLKQPPSLTLPAEGREQEQVVIAAPFLRAVLVVATMALIAWCLLLTKSRTAVLGTVCGLAVLVGGRLLVSLRRGDALTLWIRRAVVFTGIGSVLVGVAVGLLIQTGGLDIEVLSESFKSASYRLQYWQATTRLVVAHPWFGVGPGNFRQHYLKYKLPEASEEIADPHNLFFDVAATGGLVSLAGLVMLLTLTVSARLPQGREQPNASGLTSDSASPWPFWCAGAAPLLVFISLMALNGEWDDRLLVLPCVWFGVAGVRSWLVNGETSASDDVACWSFAAVVVLVVHLLGAGGISMPAVSQLLLCLVAFSLPRRAAAVPYHVTLRTNGPMWAVALIGWTVTVAAFVVTALVPATRSQSWLETGNRMALAREGRSGAEAAYRAACLADDWSSTPWHRRAELAYEQAARDRFQSNELFEVAVKLLLEAMARDPHNFHGPRTLGNWWLARWQVTQNDDDARQAFEWLGRALDSYPTNASLLAELSQAAGAAGQAADAIAAAQSALKQNELNRRLGHVDRYLADGVVARLRRQMERTQSP